MSDQIERLTAALADRYAIERFLREIEVTANLHHPSLTPGFQALRRRSGANRRFPTSRLAQRSPPHASRTD